MSSQVTDLHAVLQWYLPCHKARVMFISAFILSLLKVMTVNLTKIANGLNGCVEKRSNYRRIQRFLALFEVDYLLMAELMVHLLPPHRQWQVTLDRTTWQFGGFTINILLVGLVYQGVAFPLFWTLLDKKGNSNTAERIALMERVLTVLPAPRIQVLIGDREFIGQQWFSWLKQHHIPFAMRIRENAQVPSPTGPTQAIRRCFDDLPIQHQRILRKPRRIYGHHLYIGALRLADEYVIVVSFQPGSWALEVYRKRWGIECLFAAFKSRGFDFETTHLNERERIEKLIALLAIAFAWAFLVGRWLAQHKPLKIKKHGRKEQSLFGYGADHLQYMLLNLEAQREAFEQCVWLLMIPSIAYRN